MSGGEGECESCREMEDKLVHRVYGCLHHAWPGAKERQNYLFGVRDRVANAVAALGELTLRVGSEFCEVDPSGQCCWAHRAIEDVFGDILLGRYLEVVIRRRTRSGRAGAGEVLGREHVRSVCSGLGYVGAEAGDARFGLAIAAVLRDLDGTGDVFRDVEFILTHPASESSMGMVGILGTV